MTFTLDTGTAPLLVSMPHIGTEIPPELHGSYVPRALAVEDTDWHLARLYDQLGRLGASVIRPRYSRYLIDLNRPPDDAPMYPGASNTELCPTRFFTGDALYVAGREPDVQERERRREHYWRPYHDALGAELARIQAQHGYALLWDAHSIRSEIPWLFEGVLPGLNIGTANGASADTRVAAAVAGAAAKYPQVSHVLNGRFKGGYITRHYGNPSQNVHAVQLEMCQCLYMSEQPPYAYNEALASQVQPVIGDMMGAALAACEAMYG
ncbi:N-formylglutamate deformylase [Caenimonas koreensis DSM 17982]|uniref:N-formylglutamate deformylase n=1 Tax=Caenimonas koreensis DSM 17982 TaxID=1121255 RepID=A0A844B2J6_9BURK|nr:N-formylglutamate deformylase [Caenimonas koreensis]MRD45919.1 N-formylglutamate deformylase [Caenimonas koreensis DSM 17982]